MDNRQEIKLQIDCAYYKTLYKCSNGYKIENFLGLESYDYMERFNKAGCAGYINDVYVAVTKEDIYFGTEDSEAIMTILEWLIDYAYPSIGWECLRP